MNKPRIQVQQRPTLLDGSPMHVVRFPSNIGTGRPWFILWTPRSTLESQDDSMRHSPDMLADWKAATGRA